ncbi:hypothetical protein DMP23_19090 [Amycolatopsis sp. A1MSW2902]
MGAHEAAGAQGDRAGAQFFRGARGSEGVQLGVVAGAGDDVVELADPVAGKRPPGAGIAARFGDAGGGVVALVDMTVVDEVFVETTHSGNEVLGSVAATTGVATHDRGSSGLFGFCFEFGSGDRIRAPVAPALFQQDP